MLSRTHTPGMPIPSSTYTHNFLSCTKGKVCAVVGGCGFLGRHLTEGLLERGYQVNVFDLRTTFRNDQVQFFTGDLCRKEV